MSPAELGAIRAAVVAGLADCQRGALKPPAQEPGASPTAIPDLYTADLADFGATAAEVTDAFRKHRQTSRFWPTVADLCGHIAAARGRAKATRPGPLAFDRALELGGSCGATEEGRTRTLDMMAAEGYDRAAVDAGLRALGGWSTVLRTPLDAYTRRLWCDRFTADYDRERG